MKKIMFIIAFLGIISIAGADEFSNPIRNDEGKMTAKVITPLRFWDATPNSTPLQGEVIMGHVREYIVGDPRPGLTLPAGSIALFEGEKEAGETVSMTLSLPNSIDNVILTAQWYMLDKQPTSTLIWPSTGTTLLNGTFLWYDVQTHLYVALLIKKVDASTCTIPGPKSFEATITGKYTSI